jgi:nucleoside-diphosphate-sugar epimerase
MGCGWLGLPLGRTLVDAGYTVHGSTTRPEKRSALEEAGITPYVLTLSPTLSGDGAEAFFATDVLILNVPPPRGRDDLIDYHRRQIASAGDAAAAGSINWVLFASSTGVYPRTEGPAVETDTPDASTARSVLRSSGAALLEAERGLQDEAAFDTTIIRFAGLYGGDRDPGRFMAGRETIAGGDAPVNLIHRDDCIGIVAAILEHDARGETFNACADEHPTRRALYTAAAERLGLEPPTFEEGGTNKIVDNGKVKRVLDYAFAHPDPLKDMSGV